MSVLWEVEPSNVRDLGRALRQAEEQETPVRVRGAGLHSSASAASDHAVISTLALDAIRELDRKSALVHVEAGVRIGELSDALADAGYTLAHLGPAQPDATVGGMLARSWPTPPVVAYPDLRSACIGLTGVTSAGHRYHYLPAPRKASGPDLRGHFIGGAGRFGVITEVWLGVARAPEQQIHVELTGSSPTRLLESLRALFMEGLRPWHAAMHVSSDVTRVNLHLAGVETLVRLWRSQVEAVADNAEVKLALASEPDSERAIADHFGSGAFFGVGELDVLAEALEAVKAAGSTASVTHLNPYGGRLIAPEASALEALSELEWRAAWRDRASLTSSPLPEALRRLQSAMPGPFLARSES